MLVFLKDYQGKAKSQNDPSSDLRAHQIFLPRSPSRLHGKEGQHLQTLGDTGVIPSETNGVLTESWIL